VDAAFEDFDAGFHVSIDLLSVAVINFGADLNSPAFRCRQPVLDLVEQHRHRPNEKTGKPIARNLTDAVDGFFAGKRYLIHDRDPLYTREFFATLTTVGIKSVKLPPQSPNLNAYAERFVRTIREDCLKQMIFFGEDALRNAIREFVTHYNYAS
jgi:transposase InsO family protein